MRIPPKQRYKLDQTYTPDSFTVTCTPTPATTSRMSSTSSPPLPITQMWKTVELHLPSKPNTLERNAAALNPPLPSKKTKTQIPTKPRTPLKTTSKPVVASETSTFVLDESHVLIAVFNVKGGVAKTTLSINLAYAFAKTCNVLLTEVDPQCNIRQFFTRQLPLNTDEEIDQDDDTETEDEYIQPSGQPHQTPPHVTVNLALPQSESPTRNSKFCMPRQSARVNKNVQSSPVNELTTNDVVFPNNLYDATKNYMLGGGQEKIPTCHELPPPREVGPEPPHKVWFLPGSQNIIDLERSMSVQDRDTTGIGQHQISAFRRMMIDTMAAQNCRVAVVDFGPHAGILNRVLVTSCDLIIPPCFPDSLSYNASRTLLQTVLPNWFNWFYEFANLPQNSSMKKQLPFILPFIVTNFHTRSNSMYKSASEWTKRLQTLSANDERVTRHRIPVDITAFSTPIHDSNVICISRHEEGLNGTAHIQGVPIIELSSTRLSKAQQHAVAETRAEFLAFANLILEISSHKSIIRPQRKRKRIATIIPS